MFESAEGCLRHRPGRVEFSASLPEAFTGCFILDFLLFFLSCEKKVALLNRNFTEVKFTDIKEWGYEIVLRKGIGEAKAARYAAGSYNRFVVQTGRWRVGKTSMVHRLMEKTKEVAQSLYFFVGRKTEASLVKIYCEEER